MVDESAAFVAALREVVWEQRIADFGVVLRVDAVDARVAQTGPALPRVRGVRRPTQGHFPLSRHATIKIAMNSQG
jgi:hypothetical protein